MSEEVVNEKAVKFTLEELRRLRDQIDQRVKQLESALQDIQTAANVPTKLSAKATARLQSQVQSNTAPSEAISRLEDLPWKRAKSKKCYWVRGEEVPAEVRNILRRNRNELVVGAYRYVILDNDNVLRFDRIR